MTNYDAIIAEVHAEMVLLRKREDLFSDSKRLDYAIRTIAKRRGRWYAEIEAALDGAMARRIV